MQVIPNVTPGVRQTVEGLVDSQKANAFREPFRFAIEEGRILDDHLHDVPDPVFDLLADVGADRATVILERDGNYPAIETLLAQLRRARVVAGKSAVAGCRLPGEGGGLPAAQAFLARLYTDDVARKRFLARPYKAALAAGFGEDDARRLATIDAVGLSLAARNSARKRERATARG